MGLLYLYAYYEVTFAPLWVYPPRSHWNYATEYINMYKTMESDV